MTSTLKAKVEPLFGYVNGFCTALFNSLTIDEVEEALATKGSTSFSKKGLNEMLAVDYTPSDSVEGGKSLVTGPYLLLRDPSK